MSKAMDEIERWWGEAIRCAAAQYLLDPRLIAAIVAVESSGKAAAYRYEPGFWARYLQGKPEWAQANPRRVAASYGLMQILFVTACEYGFMGEPEELFVPATNLDYGARVLAHLLLWAQGDLGRTAAAYNGGKGNWRAAAPQIYAVRVLGRMEERCGA